MRFLWGMPVDIQKKTFKTKAMKRCKTIFYILAVLSLCMQLTAHLSPVLAAINGNWQITICSADSFRTITIDQNGDEIPATPNMRMHDCAFCAATSFTATPVQNNSLFSDTIEHTEYLNDGYEVLYTSKPHRAHQTRGPPIMS